MRQGLDTACEVGTGTGTKAWGVRRELDEREQLQDVVIRAGALSKCVTGAAIEIVKLLMPFCIVL